MILGSGQMRSAGVGVLDGFVPAESGGPENAETTTPESTDEAVIDAVSATARA